MRQVAVILAAVMSIATGGPLHCPCQFATTLERIADATGVLYSTTASSDRHCCSSKKHHGSKRPAPAAPEPAPGSPPCSCPTLDLASPLATGERAGADRQLGEADVADIGEGGLTPSTLRVHTPLSLPPNIIAATPDELRYCHSFRC